MATSASSSQYAVLWQYIIELVTIIMQFIHEQKLSSTNSAWLGEKCSTGTMIDVAWKMKQQ
jgi:hypothetical protein